MISNDHAQRAHAVLSASSATRWLNCTPSARLAEDAPRTDTVHTLEGTLAHEFAEVTLNYLLERVSYHDFDKRVGEISQECGHKGFDTKAMGEHVTAYARYVLEKYNEAKKLDPAAVIIVEQRVDFSEYVPEGFGSADAIIVANGTAYVFDLKYGAGVRVSAKANSQLKLYGLGAYLLLNLVYDINTVQLVVVQPLMDSISEDTVSVDDLLDWAQNTVKPKAAEAWTGEGEQVPGDWCQFCPVRTRCKALADEAQAIAAKDFTEPKLIDDAELLDLYAKADRLVKYLNSIGDYMLQQALSGKRWEGYKLVEGRSVRSIADELRAYELLQSEGFQREDFTNTKIKGLGDLEKLVGKKRLEEVLGECIVKPAGKPTLAPESDKRPELNSVDRAAKDFG